LNKKGLWIALRFRNASSPMLEIAWRYSDSSINNNPKMLWWRTEIKNRIKPESHRKV